MTPRGQQHTVKIKGVIHSIFTLMHPKSHIKSGLTSNSNRANDNGILAKQQSHSQSSSFQHLNRWSALCDFVQQMQERQQEQRLAAALLVQLHE
jgi:hypothetical protein